MSENIDIGAACKGAFPKLDYYSQPDPDDLKAMTPEQKVHEKLLSDLWHIPAGNLLSDAKIYRKCADLNSLEHKEEQDNKDVRRVVDTAEDEVARAIMMGEKQASMFPLEAAYDASHKPPRLTEKESRILNELHKKWDGELSFSIQNVWDNKIGPNSYYEKTHAEGSFWVEAAPTARFLREHPDIRSK
jgi:hypothetical protein